MDGFGGDKDAATEALPNAVTLMDPFHVVALAGHRLDPCRLRVHPRHPRTPRRFGRPALPRPAPPRVRLRLPSDRRRTRLEAVFAVADHIAAEVAWWTYQQIISADEQHDRARDKPLFTEVIDRLRSGLPDGLDPSRRAGQIWAAALRR